MTENMENHDGLSRRAAMLKFGAVLVQGTAFWILAESVVGCGGSSSGGGGGAPAPSNPSGGTTTTTQTVSLKAHLESEYDIQMGNGVKAALVEQVNSKQTGGVLAQGNIMVFIVENGVRRPISTDVASITVKTGDIIQIGETQTDPTKPNPGTSAADLENYVFLQGPFQSTAA